MESSRNSSLRSLNLSISYCCLPKALMVRAPSAFSFTRVFNVSSSSWTSLNIGMLWRLFTTIMEMVTTKATTRTAQRVRLIMAAAMTSATITIGTRRAFLRALSMKIWMRVVSAVRRVISVDPPNLLKSFCEKVMILLNRSLRTSHVTLALRYALRYDTRTMDSPYTSVMRIILTPASLMNPMSWLATPPLRIAWVSERTWSCRYTWSTTNTSRISICFQYGTT